MRIKAKLRYYNTKCKLVDPVVVDVKGKDITNEFMKSQIQFQKRFLLKETLDCIKKVKSESKDKDEVLK